jgi:hypothetical protein
MMMGAGKRFVRVTCVLFWSQSAGETELGSGREGMVAVALWM